jgi:ABC-type Fe3+/spermidine/putrescine transport system ATPase subunit
VASPREIYNRPATAYAAQFIGHTNLLKGEVRGGTAQCGALAWPTSLPDGPALFSLRPEHVRVAGPGTSSSGAIRIRGRVVHQAFHGGTELIRVECGGGLVLTVRTPSRGEAQGQAQNEIELEFSAADAVPVRESPERN